MPLTLMYITNDETVADIAQMHGVDRVWIDLEQLGKEDRQKHMNTVKSHHTVADIERLAKRLDRAELLVRINPWNSTSADEIERVIAAGADMIMLPMWKSAAEVSAFLASVGGRVKTTLLLETKEAVDCVDEVLQNGGFDEIHIGLNDLHLSYGLTFMFELLTDGTVERLCRKFRESGIPYGFGGIARLGGGLLPAEHIIIEHARLGSTRAILSRSFCNPETETDVAAAFGEQMRLLRDFEDTLPSLSDEDFRRNREAVCQKVAAIVADIRSKT